MSQPPGEPRSDDESAAREREQAGGPAEAEPGSKRDGSSPPPETPAPASAEANADHRPEPDSASEHDAEYEHASTPGGGEQQPWWSQGQPAHGAQPPPPPPHGGQSPYPQQAPPYPQPYQQPAPPPWAYGQQAPPGPPGWTRPGGSADATVERDRVSLHLMWEGVLAVIAIALLVITATMTPDRNLTVALDQAGAIGLLATGFAFSVRTGSPNLAAGSILFFSSTLSAYLISESGWSKPAAFLVAIMLSTLIGLVLGFLVAVLSAPSWAVTLGAGAAIEAVVLGLVDRPIIPVRFTGHYPTALWYGLFFVISVGGGALWLVPGLRRALSGTREPGDPARWLGLRAGLGPIAGLTGSGFLAGLAAVPLLMRVQASSPGTSSQLTLTLAAVLLGGVSVFGRRAGVFGTFLAVTILALVQNLLIYNGEPVWVLTLIVGLAALAGVGVSRAIESVNGVLNRTPSPVVAPQPGMAPQLPPPPPDR